MKNSEILWKHNSLPHHLKKEFDDFLNELVPKSESKDKLIEKRPLGLAKGLIKIRPDFEGPLEDFNYYMN